ncbi:hypothetical protein B9Z55_007560 [Caenorhabditis nigoni]|uniref:Uncharacterized protein n=1 Tax=Caenorhabditis nigoni TaxID=1611254 RepID=A0A2G5VA48_9PELO|nr:hypothetical protein B9Z55_007560 [Caenorhabditis nigoni]
MKEKIYTARLEKENEISVKVSNLEKKIKMDDEEVAPVEVITVDSDSDTGGTITIRSNRTNMIRQRPPSPIPTLEESFKLMAERFKYLEEKMRVEKCPDNTFCISCLAVKRAYNHGCPQTPWKEAFESAFLGVSILNSAFVEHCWEVSAQTAGPDAVDEKRKVEWMRKGAREEEGRQMSTVDTAQDTSHALDNIKVPIAKKDNDAMIHHYLQQYQRLQWLKQSDIPMAKPMSGGPKVECMFCIFCYKLHHIGSEKCPAKENEREAVKQLHAKSRGISMLNKEVVEKMLEFLNKKYRYHVMLKYERGPFLDSDLPQEEKPKTEARPIATDAELHSAFNQIHEALHLQNIPIENSIKVVCFRCFSPRSCQCPNAAALKRAAQKLWKIIKDFPTIEGVLKERCADFALHEAGIHEKHVEAMQLSESLRGFVGENESSDYVSSDEETNDDMSSDDDADDGAPSTSNQWFNGRRRPTPGPSDADIEIEEDEESDDELDDDEVNNVEAEAAFRKVLIVLNDVELVAPIISWNKFCNTYRGMYQQLFPGRKNKADVFAKNKFRKIRNQFKGVNGEALKLFQKFAYIQKNKYANLREIDELRQSILKENRNMESDEEEDPAEDGDDEKEEEEVRKMDSDDHDGANPAEPMKRKRGRPLGSRKSRAHRDPVVRLCGRRRLRCSKTKRDQEPPKKK